LDSGNALSPRRSSRLPTGRDSWRFLCNRCTIFPLAAGSTLMRPVSGHLGGHAIVRPGMQALPRGGPAHCSSRRAYQCRGQGAYRPDRPDACADLRVYRRRSPKEKGCFRTDPVCGRQGCAGGCNAQRHPLLTREAMFKLKEAGWCGWVSRWTFHAGNSRCVPGPSRRVGADDSGNRVGQRGRHSHPGTLHHQSP